VGSQFPLRLDYGRSPHAYVNQKLQIQLELLMMSGVPLETCSAFNEWWNNKFCYKVASCWLFLLNQFSVFEFWGTYTGCFKKSFTTLKAYRNLYRGHTQRFELSKCNKTHIVLPRIVIRNCFDLFFRFLLHGTSTVTPTPKSNGPYRSHNNEHYAHD
jgi:hypothetical protein